MHDPTAAVLLGIAGLTPRTLASPLHAHPGGTPSPRAIFGFLPSAASDIEYKFQPLYDFDTDGCYFTSAINGGGSTNPGIRGTLGAALPVGREGFADDCRGMAQLENNNIYSRKRCNNGFCAVMYEHYFEKDQALFGSLVGGHTDDWENIVVFSQGDRVVRVAPSCHGRYDWAWNAITTEQMVSEGVGAGLVAVTAALAGKIAADAAAKWQPMEGTRPKVVYHKDGRNGLTHCFRMAGEGDERIENHTGGWFTGRLVGWDYWPNVGLRERMLQRWSGGVGPKFTDSENKFVNNLREAAADKVPGFDPAKDE